MRINIYAEEITNEVDIISKTVNQELFYGVSLYLHSPKELHSGTSDDDRNAITLWVPWTKKGGYKPEGVILALEEMTNQLTSYTQVRGHL